MDVELHAERVESRTRSRRSWQAPVSELPAGSMLWHEHGPALLVDGTLRPWTITGYGPARSARPAEIVTVLTPPRIVAALAQGYLPMVHPSVGATSLRAMAQPVEPSPAIANPSAITA